MEQGHGSSSKQHHQIHDEQSVNGEGHNMESLADDFKSLLIVPSNSTYSDVELRSDEVEIHSDVEQGWCNITRSSDLCSATLQNKSLNVNFVNETNVPTEDTIMNRCGSEIIPNPVSDDHSSYRLNIKPMNETCKKVFKVKKNICK
ncbi:uncharacterized protein LOC143576251 [Bidens hawaiensis]|uniref:uncharacterized protein LOC143576251 n=1 Tax=Bidens hawaiensis TaxID=980011 RepID=UPI0040493F26